MLGHFKQISSFSYSIRVVYTILIVKQNSLTQTQERERERKLTDVLYSS